MDLRDYQQTALDVARDFYQGGYRSVLLVAPTGAGKTWIAAAVVRGVLEKGGTVLILAHLRVLVQQMVDSLRQQGVSASVMMGGQRNLSGAVIVGTPHTWNLLADTERPDVDLLLVDEAHHIDEGLYADVVSHYERIGTRVLGFTATPLKSTLRHFNVHHVATDPLSLLDRGVLCPSRYYVRDFSDTERDIRNPVRYASVFEEWCKFSAGRRTLAFCDSVAESRQLAAHFVERGIPAHHVDAHTPKGEREWVNTEHAAGRILLVSNVGIYLEGFDNPAIETVLLLRKVPAQHAQDQVFRYVQMVGRGLRTYPGKDICHILDFCGYYATYGRAEEYIPDFSEESRMERLEGSRFKTCPECFARVPNVYSACPDCGFPFPVGANTLEAENDIGRVDAVLSEVSEEETLRNKRRIQQLRKQAAMATSFEQVRRIGEQLGYRPGWAHIYWRAKNQRRQLRKR
ncbi:DEAD/DEAH box helicase [Acidithiobacillus sp. M4-SHS-6]|uniref:DEAD/DEAH box helicase n=1 Tax=Acidithiobacillus sp. M4-SHS-6 TaxID=3383024 RepID=UPI0039BDA3C6